MGGPRLFCGTLRRDQGNAIISCEQFRAWLEVCRMSAPATSNTLRYSLPPAESRAVEQALDDWQANNKVTRLWQRDASLWTGADEAKWMGWLDVVQQQIADLPSLLDLAAEVKREGFKHALLLGMGGSSLCPEVTALTFGQQSGAPALHVLDSTDPAQVKAVEAAIDLRATIFIVASKSGSTLEPNIFKQYFF